MVLTPLIACDNSILDVNNAVSVFGDVMLVRDKDNGVAFALQSVKQRHNFQAGLRIQVSGGFVRQNDRGFIDQRTGNRDALSLTTGKFIRVL